MAGKRLEPDSSDNKSSKDPSIRRHKDRGLFQKVGKVGAGRTESLVKRSRFARDPGDSKKRVIKLATPIGEFFVDASLRMEIEGKEIGMRK